MQFLSAVKLILSLLPMIIQVVQAIEAALPASGQGATKLAMIKEVLQSAYSTATDVTATFETVWPALEGTIKAVVSMFNSAGAFKK